MDQIAGIRTNLEEARKQIAKFPYTAPELRAERLAMIESCVARAQLLLTPPTTEALAVQQDRIASTARRIFIQAMVVPMENSAEERIRMDGSSESVRGDARMALIAAEIFERLAVKP